MLTSVERKILNLCQKQENKAISVFELRRALGKNSSQIIELLRRGWINRHVVNGVTYYKLTSNYLSSGFQVETKARLQPSNPTWQPTAVNNLANDGNAIDRHLRQWGSCTIQAAFIPWESDSKPIYQMLEGKNRW